MRKNNYQRIAKVLLLYNHNILFLLANVAKEKFATEDYKNIVCIIGLDAYLNPTIIKNDIYSDISENSET
ncbi:MAG: hypothetical protein WAM14_10015 [Candidatus Nitrosopolaris sp.]